MIPGSASQFFLGASQAAGGATGGIQVSRSLRFNASDSAFCSRTPAVAGNRRTWTWAGWVKRSGLGAYQRFFATLEIGVVQEYLRFENNDTLRLFEAAGNLTTTQVFRDTSAWFHLVVSVDTTQATSSDRIKLYVNGTQVTSFSTATYPSQNFDTQFNRTIPHYLGSGQVEYFSGYLADIHFIDGQQLTPSSFTEVSATTGQLIPKAYTGTFGTNGFWLKFSDNSAATAATLGKDYSGNSNNWTPNNLSVTAGSGNDSLVDTPTSYGTDTGVGGEVRGNYATLNPLDKSSSFTLSNGNLDATTSGGYLHSYATIFPASGKYYFEMLLSRIGGNGGIALANILSTSSDLSATKITLNGWSGGYQVYVNSSYNNVSGFTSANAGDILKLAYDAGTGEVWLGVNEYWITSSYARQTSFPSTATGTVTTPVKVQAVFYNIDGSFNFGQRAWDYTAPTNYQPIVDTLLPAPVVAKPNTVMDVVLYTGTGAALTPTSSLGFNPDWIWIKSRSAATDHALYDVVRGAQARLESNTTDAEVTTDGGVTAFNSAGFTLGTLAQVNTSSATYAAWCWGAGTSTVSNTAGSITSQVRANASAGFSIATFNMSSAGTYTVGHGLGVAPEFIITKSRGPNTFYWRIYHKTLGTSQCLQFDNGAAATSSNIWSSTSPSSTVFGIVSGQTQPANDNIVAYCFAPVVGYSSFGSYVGNGSSDGVFVYTGFRPRFILIKRSSGIGDWAIYDSVRLTYNESNVQLYADTSGAEIVDDPLDILSNGFKIRGTGSGFNASSNTYVYAAFAENPFQYARAR